MTTSAPLRSRATNNMTSSVCAAMNCMLARGGQRAAAAHPTTVGVSPALRAEAKHPQPTPA
eukprot:747089-Alexandrium_andersonii.AAC.1